MFYAVNPGVLEVNLLPGNGGAPVKLWLSWDSDTTWTFVYDADFVVPNRKYGVKCPCCMKFWVNIPIPFTNVI
jgi:hypothetical protein